SLLDAGGARVIERSLRGMELVHDDQRLAAPLLEGHRGHRPILTALLVGPREARVWSHLEIPAVERGALRGGAVAKHEAVRAPDANVHLAGTQRHADRLRYPPSPEQLRLGPRLEHDARRAVERSHDHELAVGFAFHRGAALRGDDITLTSCVH